jgi:rare lipoprotein A
MQKPITLALALFCSVAFLAANAQQSEYGQASFYDDSFQGSKTAYNVVYNKNELTASHKIYPYGTLLRVTRLDNKKSVIVKVIDKGPYIKGRVVDLSKKAASQLAMVDDGVANVKVELYQKAADAPETTIEAPARQPAATSRTTTTPSRTSDRTATASREPEEVPAGFEAPRTTTKPRTTVRPVANDDEPTVVRTKNTTATTAKKPVAAEKTTIKKTAPARLVKQDYTKYGLYKIQLERPVKKGFGVQVASLENYESVMRQVASLQSKSFDNILVSIEQDSKVKTKTLYKVILGPQDTEAAATSYKNNLKKRYKMNGFVVDLTTL